MTAVRRAHTASAIRALRVVAVLRTPSAESAIEVGEQLVATGLTVVEVALTTPGGLKAIAALAASRTVGSSAQALSSTPG